jgi:hypothetical protein
LKFLKYLENSMKSTALLFILLVLATTVFAQVDANDFKGEGNLAINNGVRNTADGHDNLFDGDDNAAKGSQNKFKGNLNQA